MKMSSAAAVAILLVTGCTTQQAGSLRQATPLPERSAPATAAASAGASGPMAFEDIEAGTELRPGSYTFNFSSVGGERSFPTLAITFTAPERWSRVLLDGVVWHDSARIGFFIVDNLYANPCDPAKGLVDPPVGPAVADLTSALMAYRGWEQAVISEASQDGFDGQRVQNIVPDDGLGCEPADSRLMRTLGNPGYILAPGPGEQIEMRVLDVDGARLVMVALALADAPASMPAEMTAVLDSVQIQP